MGDNNYKKAHKAAGLCYDCSEPVYPGKTRCLKHCRTHSKANGKSYRKDMEKYRKYQKSWREKRIEEGLCSRCGGPRDDPNLLQCVNCRGRIYEGRCDNAYPIV